MSIRVSVKYNPFIMSTEVRVDDELPREHSELANFIAERDDQPVFDWFGRFLEKLYSARRNGDIRVSFSGTEDDGKVFHDVVDAISEKHKKEIMWQSL